MTIVEKDCFVNNIRLHVVEAGAPAGKVLLFLHGFPEFWYGWRKQIQFFAEKGFRVIVPDQRGYNSSSKPTGVKAYTLEHLVADVVALIQQTANEKVYLVGHDWGGAVAWAVAILYPKLLEKLIILNMPHPKVMKRNLQKNPKQMLRSWYAGFFQMPLLPELCCSAFHYSLLEKSMAGTALKNAFSEGELGHYKRAWEQLGALNSMINWYRAYKYSKLNLAADVQVPTLMLWGKRDKFLGAEMASESIRKCVNGQLLLLEGTTHWLHHERPEQVNNAIYQFIV
ncbi:alpha/beta fold hydrolase [Pontibacter harenae]|uniref:alpha/beta fold hydrolase n=1 Tax=Pontibacter harenae TaxID=2894083 RepID=UPI001E3335D7|nr:alpha/beta hydrolase [Pontibacter harenae]MCC9167509.1 alpha/beta hydrolase [Pontibacter harenae]